MNKCERCGQALQPIGDQRKNGKEHLKDWPERKYHEKCWNELQDINTAKFDPKTALNKFRQHQEQDIQNEINKFEEHQKKITDQEKQ